MRVSLGLEHAHALTSTNRLSVDWRALVPIGAAPAMMLLSPVTWEVCQKRRTGEDAMAAKQ